MALIRGAYGGGQIKGSISGVTFQQSPYGTVARNRTIPVNPNSPAQVAIRAAMSTMSGRWSNILSNAQRAAWEAYAAATPVLNKFGDSILISGRQFFLRYNNAITRLGGAPIDTAPATPGVAAEASLVLSASSIIGVNVVSSSIIPVGIGAILINTGIPVNFARNFYKAPFTQRSGITAATVFPLNIIPPAEVAVGQRWFVFSRHFQADGKVANPQITFADVTV